MLGVSMVMLSTSGWTVMAQPCTGDCNGDDMVTIGELITGVNVALDQRAIDDCPGFDCNGTGRVTVDCLVRAVSDALTGCGPGTSTLGGLYRGFTSQSQEIRFNIAETPTGYALLPDAGVSIVGNFPADYAFGVDCGVGGAFITAAHVVPPILVVDGHWRISSNAGSPGTNSIPYTLDANCTGSTCTGTLEVRGACPVGTLTWSATANGNAVASLVGGAPAWISHGVIATPSGSYETFFEYQPEQ